MERATYNGWLIQSWDAGDEDCRKMVWDCYPPGTWEIGGPRNTATINGRCVDTDLSPYSRNGFNQAAALIDLDFPKRETIGSIAPLNQKDIERLWTERFGNKPMPTAEKI